MTFSITSFLTVMFFSSLLIICIWFFLKNNKLVKGIGIGTLLFCMAIIIFRMLLPFEYAFANNLPFKWGLPIIVQFFETPFTIFDKFTISYSHVLYLFWGIGMLFHLIKETISYIRFNRIMSNYPYITDISIQTTMEKVLLKYNKSVSFKILRTNLISTPMIFGIWNPKIAIPQIELSQEEWHHILSHEVAHYYHGDLWVKIITEILCIIYWWNPFIYLLKKQISQALEINIDLTITKSMSEIEKINYLECLLKIAKSHINKKVFKIALAFDSESSSHLSQRFYIVLDNNTSKTKTNLKSISLSVTPILLIALISFCFVFEPYSISQEDEAYTVELTNKNAYLVLNQNSGYDMYLNDKYFGTVNDIKDSYSDLPIYKNIMEVEKNGKTK